MFKYKAVLFDFDGTLMNTNEVILGSWKHLYKEVRDYDLKPEEITETFGEPLLDSLKRLFPDDDIEKVKSIYQTYQNRIWNKPIEMFPGTEDMVRRLHWEGVRIAIVSSRLWKATDKRFYRFPIEDVIDTIVSAEDTTIHKPDPEPCLICLKKMGLKADDVLFVGDSRFDMACGHNAGIRTVLVGWSVCMPEKFRTGIWNPDFIIEKPEDLCDLVLE